MEHRLTQPKAGRTRRPNGFTLFELIVAMGLSLGIMAAGITLYVNALKSSAVNQAQVSANSSARLTLGYIDKDLKQAILIPCATGATGCNSASSVTLTTPASAAGTYTPDKDTLVLQMPAWNATLSETINGVYDTVIYQYVILQTTHKCYNVRRIVSPGAGSSRLAEDRWLLPYESERDATDSTIKRSEPWLDYASGSSSKIFRYFVQQKVSGVATGQTIERTTEAWKDVVMVETRFNVVKTYDNSTISAEAVTRSRLRNWAP